MKKNPAAELARKRWKGVSKEDRRKHMKMMSDKAKEKKNSRDAYDRYEG